MFYPDKVGKAMEMTGSGGTFDWVEIGQKFDCMYNLEMCNTGGTVMLWTYIQDQGEAYTVIEECEAGNNQMGMILHSSDTGM